MSRADELSQRGRGSSRVWRDFILAYQQNTTRLYCFFEGIDDPKYYNLRIKSIIFQEKVDNIRPFQCEGKETVINVCNLVLNDIRYQKAWVAFFIDKDFDDVAELPHNDVLFITPCYSIENLYVSQQVLERILRDEFFLAETDSDFQSTINLFNLRLSEFNAASEELNAWLYLQRQAEKTTGNATKLSIREKLKNEDLFLVNISKIDKKYSVHDLIQKFPEAPIISPEELSHQINEFRHKGGGTLNFRGKHLIFFLNRFLMGLVEDRRQKNNKRLHFTERGTVKLQLSENIISELSQYANTPESLYKFLVKIANIREKQLELDL